jgi:hypothetical protein
MVGGGRDFKKQELKEGVRECGAGGFLIGLRPEVKDSPNHPNKVRLEFQATYTSPNGISAAEIAHITALTGRQKKGKRLPPRELMYLSRSSVGADLRVKMQDREFKDVRQRVIGMLTKPKDKKRKPEPAAHSNARKEPHRAKPGVSEAAQVKDTKARQVRREDPDVRAGEQVDDTKNRKSARSKNAVDRGASWRVFMSQRKNETAEDRKVRRVRESKTTHSTNTGGRISGCISAYKIQVQIHQSGRRRSFVFALVFAYRKYIRKYRGLERARMVAAANTRSWCLNTSVLILDNKLNYLHAHHSSGVW